ncbi:inosine/guanosine kinase [Paraneptunicella aestuarii]|uniref:inosine/guanosine kinase n=1 Tax=Paraneptunicella aestuarii TaxID=2831148 RepID=UPI001E35D2B4|nr:inosine/guanosine kinase [Paraneptunicella aestuarii]UAA38405.1 inosine/guanosine kinase [Paraneptunicella aestuarii]
MKFPGRRKHKHYFPIQEKILMNDNNESAQQLQSSHIVGIDQVLVDIEAKVEDSFLNKYGLQRGMSQIISDSLTDDLYEELKTRELINYEHAGGTIGNTLHNYSVLADAHSVLLGVMSENIRIGNYAYRYISNTSSRVNLNYLQPVDGPIGRCFTLIDSSGERTFAISPGHTNRLHPDNIDDDIIKSASALLISSYLMRTQEGDSMDKATFRAVETAKAAGVPVVLTLGTRHLIEQDPKWWRDFAKEHVDVLTMNEEEGEALTGETNPLLAADKALDLVDMVMCTAGSKGLYMAGYTDEKFKRETERPLLDGAIKNFNQYEYSRAMRLKDCENPIRAYTHVAPYMGGPVNIKNTNGAGDGALAAVLHDMAANDFHKMNVTNSSKHTQNALTYSSFSQISKYANRVSYQVLTQHSPRLSRGLPEREDSLEHSYWAE